jgi:ubiquinone/menaquinone biosynthesis C-methylase UbiE
MSVATDWSSYDTIAARYDEAWGQRFTTVAQLLWDRVPLRPGASVLDIGTGTGIVLRALATRRADVTVTGCDQAIGMVEAARLRFPVARFLCADAATLPFRGESFDAVTASFVLSHLPDYGAGIAEASRVLRPGGVFAMTSWATDTDVHVKAWRELLGAAVSEELLRGAIGDVVPWEAYFENVEGVRTALSLAGLGRVQVHTLTAECRLSVEQFIAERALGSSARFARHTLGPDAWEAFLARAHEALHRRFGSMIECPRGILVGVGYRADA